MGILSHVFAGQIVFLGQMTLPAATGAMAWGSSAGSPSSSHSSCLRSTCGSSSPPLGVAPLEAAFRKPHVVHAPAVHVGAQKLGLLAVAAHEAVQRAVHGVAPEVGGRDRRQPLDVGAHVLRPLRYVDGVGGGERVQSDAAALVAAAMSDSAAPAGMASSTRPTSARMGRAAAASPPISAEASAGAGSRPAASPTGTMALASAMPPAVTFIQLDASLDLRGKPAGLFLPEAGHPPAQVRSRHFVQPAPFLDGRVGGQAPLYAARPHVPLLRTVHRRTSESIELANNLEATGPGC